MLRRHWAFGVVLMAGTALRVLTWIAYQPALFYSDSVNYLHNTGHLPGTAWHPPGYPVLLDLLLIGHHLAVVTAVQHLLVLADAIAWYAVLLRLGCGRAAATLAVTPVLLDAYQVQIEQYVLSEALFETLLTAALLTALWSHGRWLTAARAASVGLLLSLSALVRLDAVAMVIPLLGWLIWSGRRQGHRLGWQPVTAGLVVFALPLGLLAGLRGGAGNGASLTGNGAIWVYGRVAPFADCASDDVPENQQALCPAQPVAQRPGPAYFENSPSSPVRRYLAEHPDGTPTVESFAERIALHQPLDYLAAAADDFATQFRPTRAQTAGDPDVRPWLFRLTLQPVDPTKPQPQPLVDHYGTGKARLDLPVARVLRSYQRFGFLPGPVMLALLIAGAFTLLARRRNVMAPALWLLLSAAVMTVLFASATVVFSWRYVLPTLLLYPPAGALAWRMWRQPDEQPQR